MGRGMAGRRPGAGLAVDAAQREALAEAGLALAEAVKARLPRGEPVGVSTGADGVVVGTSAPGAGGREFGRPGQPPRPVLGMAAAELGGTAARQVGAAVAAAIAATIGRR